MLQPGCIVRQARITTYEARIQARITTFLIWQARITSFLPCDDEDTCRMAPDVVSFAIKRGYWKGGATDPAFSFSGTYDPVTFEGARFCEVPQLLTTLHPLVHAALLSMLYHLAR